ncbi:hypothetical protein [Microcystis phage Mvi-JY20]|uniref:Terminase small subunit n=1 Tax=Microcystis phage Mvi-JY20 TaxID=3128146 RepID=A0AAX4QHS9_9CAUD
MANITTNANANTETLTAPRNQRGLKDLATTYYELWETRQEADKKLKQLTPMLTEALKEEGVGGVMVRDHDAGCDYSILGTDDVTYALIPDRVKECLSAIDRNALLNKMFTLMTATQLNAILRASLPDATPKQIEGIVATVRECVKVDTKLKVHAKPHTFTGDGKLIEPKLTPTEAKTKLATVTRRKQKSGGMQ